MTKFRRGFTLVELLVAIFIIALLMAILFPVFARARDKGYQTSCFSNLKQVGTAFQLYRSDFDGRMPYMFLQAGDGTYYRWIDVTFVYSGTEQIYQCPACEVEPADEPAYPPYKTPKEPRDTSYLYNQPHLEATRETLVRDPGGTIMVMDGWWFSSHDEENARTLNAPMFNIEKATADMMACWINNEIPAVPMYVNGKILERLHRHPGNMVSVLYFDGHAKGVVRAVPGDFTPQKD